MTRPPSHRARFLVGLAVAALLGVGLGERLLHAGRAAVTEARAQREAVAALLQLTDLARRAGAEGEPLRRVVAAWQAKAPRPSTARVILFQGIRLEASTAPVDVGEKAAPRRLSRDEKPLFDLGQRLRAAVQGNREGGPSRPELEVERTTRGGFALAAPLERDGQAVVGAVLIEVPPPTPAPASPLAAVLAVVLPVAAFALLSRALPERRGPVALVACACLAAALLAHGAWAARALAGDRRAAHAAVSARVKALAAESVGMAVTLGLPEAPVRPGAWDADRYRRPLGYLTSGGDVDPARVAESAATADRDAFVMRLAIAALALLVLAVVGLGAASGIAAELRRHRAAYLYVAPAMIGMLVLVFFPFLYGITLSFTDSNIYNTNRPLTEIWISLRNYAAILGDWRVVRRAADGSLIFNYLSFYWTLGFNVLWTVANVAIGVSVGLVLALVLNTKGLALRPIYRVILILPWAMPNYITALIWRGMFHRQFGVVNHAMALVGLQPISWFDKPFTSFLTALATNGWLSFPFMMVVSLGALQSIPADIYEAARVDGATRWQQFKAITLPSLRPALVPAVILSVVWTFNMFNIIFLVTGGEPGGATEILVTQAYKYAFERYRYGYAAAYSTIIFAVLLVYGVFQNRVTRATEGI